MANITTIQVQKATKKKLENLKDYERETLDDVIKKLIQITEKVEKKVRVNRLSSALLSEKSLAKIWLSKEEDDAWKDL